MTKIKNLFSTPKKAVISIICIAAIVAALCIGGAFIARAAVQSSSIGADKAQNFAFADAGVDPAAAQVTKTEFEFEHGQFVYEIEFVADSTEYDYWIKASDGSVVKKEKEIILPDGTNKTVTAKITVEKAKEIALADAGLTAKDVTFTSEKLDTDNGVSVYDIDFYNSGAGYEYEYEINADNGNIYSKSKEIYTPNQTNADSNANQQSGNNQQSGQPTESGIGTDAAKSKALADAGLKAQDVTFTKERLDYDDGVAVYDIEFRSDTKEYDYEIDAATGDIRSKDIDNIRASGNQNKNNGAADSGSYIGIDKAKSIAASNAGVSVSDVTFSKAKLDNDDGYTVYEIEFYKDGVEYEYTINAQTGAIMESDRDWN